MRILGGEQEFLKFKQNPNYSETCLDFISNWFETVRNAQTNEEIKEVLTKAKNELWRWAKGSEGHESIESLITLCEKKLIKSREEGK